MLVSVREVQLWQAVDIVSGAVVLGVGALAARRRRRRRSTRSRSPSRSLLGAVLIYCFWLVIATVRVLGRAHVVLPELFEGIFQTGRWPVGIYPGWLRFGDHVPRADRVRGHRAGRGGHVAARLADARLRRGLHGCRRSRSRAGSGASGCGATGRLGMTSRARRRPGTTVSSRAGGRSSTSTDRRSTTSGPFVEAGQPALDAACGTGRLLVPYLQRRLSTSTAATSRPTCSRSPRARCARGPRPAEPLRAGAARARPSAAGIGRSSSAAASGSAASAITTSRRFGGCFAHLEPGGTLVLDNEAPYRAAGPVAATGSKDERSGASARSTATRATGASPIGRPELELRSRILAVDPLAQRVVDRDASRRSEARTASLSPRRSTPSR